MAHSKNKILLLVEGYRTEPNIMKAYAKRLEEEFELNVVSFDTNIYVLYQNIKSLNEEMGLESTSTLDMLKSILRERERKFADNNNTDELIKIKNDLEILDQKYPYVYLLFESIYLFQSIIFVNYLVWFFVYRMLYIPARFLNVQFYH